MRTLAPAPTALQGLQVGGRALQGTRASRALGAWQRQARRGGAVGAARVGAPPRTEVMVRAADQGGVGATTKRSVDEGGPSPIRCAYQGVPGAYSESAALLAYEGCDPVPCDQFEDAFGAVESWQVDRAVLPVENSLGGSIHRNYDLLLRHRLHIVGEVNLPVNHCLLAPPGTTKEQVKRVMSHPQALAQCENYCNKLGVTMEAMADTAGSAMHIIKEGLTETAAICSARAADIYGLDVLDTNIQDDSNNITRFIALSRTPVPPKAGGRYKTSLVFALNEGSGVLFKALSCFALRDIDLTKIESRPMRSEPLFTTGEHDEKGGIERRFQYLFYVDFKASMADTNAQNAVKHLEEMTTYLRVLGCYPMD